jgi:hypothetical protein
MVTSHLRLNRKEAIRRWIIEEMRQSVAIKLYNPDQGWGRFKEFRYLLKALGIGPAVTRRDMRAFMMPLANPYAKPQQYYCDSG